MKKRIVVTTSMLLTLGALSACTSETKVDYQNEKKKQTIDSNEIHQKDIKEVNKNETEQPQQNATVQKEPKQHKIIQPEQNKLDSPKAFVSLDTIQKQMQLGLTKEVVEKRLGKHFVEVKNSMDGNNIWRYDFGTIEGYRSSDNKYDTVDVKGLKNKNVTLQLFINWSSKGTVKSYSVYYLDEKDGKVYGYFVLEDETKKIEQISQ
jgi:hypothetical protein